jgi:single-strand DNA-binding protein
MEMSQDDQITVRGYVTAEPRFWQRTETRAPLATIRVGSTPRRLNRETGEWQDGEPSYYTVKCWRRLAENVHGSLRKGDMVLVRGKVSTRRWLDDQQQVRTEVQIEADTVGHDLAFGWSHFNRGVHTPAGAMRDIERGEAARHDMPQAPDLPDDTRFDDTRFDTRFDETRFSDDGDEAGVPPDHGSGDPAELAGDAAQPVDAAAPF